MRTKAEIRSCFLRKRKEIGREQRQQLSQQIVDQAMKYVEENRWINHIHVFLPIDKQHEINTWLLVRKLFHLQKMVYTSVTDFDRKVMRTVKIGIESKFVEDKFGLPVAVNPSFTLESQQFDLVFVPLLAFDLNGVRLGYGKGYYDRFFATLKKDVRKLGLSYFPATELLPRESHDVLLDGCILPDQIICFTK